MTASWDDAVLDADGTADGGAVTLGVAVAVPEPFASALRDSRAATGDPVALAVPPHVTIVPPVLVPPAEVPAIVEHVRRTAALLPRFAVVLSGTDTFRPVSEVVFVRVVDGGQACDRLQQAVRTGPLQRDLSFPYHPHVTVAHDVPTAALDRVQSALSGFHAAFDVHEVAVFRCAGDGVWRSLSPAPLAEPGPGEGAR
ncbi:2'-5' RNA ligase family protein [Jannaschia sp. R86511]|uniref:2'-5' RNA ligase family protein n=1 Tax=Jannaschia sp. R86511 TaxID=3093853 RepID=UPI0036D3ABA4